jgi:hypothetical protein
MPLPRFIIGFIACCITSFANGTLLASLLTEAN